MEAKATAVDYKRKKLEIQLDISSIFADRVEDSSATSSSSPVVCDRALQQFVLRFDCREEHKVAKKKKERRKDKVIERKSDLQAGKKFDKGKVIHGSDTRYSDRRRVIQKGGEKKTRRREPTSRTRVKTQRAREQIYWQTKNAANIEWYFW